MHKKEEWALLTKIRDNIVEDNDKEQANRYILRALAMKIGCRQNLVSPDEMPEIAASLPLIDARELGLAYQVLAADKISRKESGSFYTPAQIAVRLTACCLRPFVYMGKNPVLPEKILLLKVCDPAMGGGSFLLAALDYLTNILKVSLEYHQRIEKSARKYKIFVNQHFYEVPSEDLTLFLRRLTADCLYGVDVDPAAAEAARFSVGLEAGISDTFKASIAARLKTGDALSCPPDITASRVCPAKQGHDDAGIKQKADEWVFGQTDGILDRRDFFHWGLEFPQVFRRGGFDAVIGNPPWETLQPSSKEFFTSFDSSYRALGQLQARSRRKELLKDPVICAKWQEYRKQYKDLSGFYSRIYKYQGGGKAATYKLFLEQSYRLLKSGGRAGLLLPSNLLSDQGAAPLRRMLLENCRWELFMGMQNRDLPFAIASGFKFGALVFEKNSRTDSIVMSSANNPKDWDAADGIKLTKALIHKFSPHQLALPSCSNERDIAVLQKIYQDSQRMEHSAWGIHFAQGDFNMTSASALFPPLSWWKERGFAPCSDGRWRNMKGEEALPLYEGRMIGQYDFSKKGWVSGKGRFAHWKDIPFACKTIQPQYLISARHCRKIPLQEGRSPIMNISSAFNSRSAIAAYLRGFPCNHSLNPVCLTAGGGVRAHMAFLGIINSFVFDFALRQRLEGFNLSFFLLKEMPLPDYDRVISCRPLLEAVSRLSLLHPLFEKERDEMARYCPNLRDIYSNNNTITSAAERLRLRCIADALAGRLYGLDEEDMAWILRDCCYPVEKLHQKGFIRSLHPRGFWRVDKNRPPHLRHTVLALEAYKYVSAKGTDAALDWQLPFKGRDAL